MTADFLGRTCAELSGLLTQSSSRFDGAHFSELASERGGRLWQEVSADVHGEIVLRSYLRLLGEAVSMGCVAKGGRGHQNVLSLLLVELVPDHLANVAPDQRTACLATLWNLGEGLLQEPSWLNRYTVAMCTGFAALQQLSDHVAHVLEPVLAPRPPASWRVQLSPDPAFFGMRG